MSDKNIYQRVNAVMKECEYLQKRGAAQGKGVKYDEVIAMIRDLLIKHGIVMQTNQASLVLVDGAGAGNQKLYQGEYTLTLINMDKPEETITHSSIAQGMDGGDKGAGKAHTYAMKQMLVKGFGIETGDDEESRSEKAEANTFLTLEHKQQINGLIKSTSTDKNQLLAHFRVQRIDDMSIKTALQAINMLELKAAKNG